MWKMPGIWTTMQKPKKYKEKRCSCLRFQRRRRRAPETCIYYLQFPCAGFERVNNKQRMQ